METCGPPYGQPLPHDELRSKILPDNASVWVYAANLLYPDPEMNPVKRREMLQAANARWITGPAPTHPTDWGTWGSVCE